MLGPARVHLDEDDASPLELTSRKPRSILTALALRLGRDVPADTLIDLVWGEDAPRSALGTLQAYISGLRRALEPGLVPRQRPAVLLTTDRGYRLHLSASCVDAHAFTDEVLARHRVLAPLAGQLGGASGASDRAGWPTREVVSEQVDALERALGWWTGEPYEDLPDHPDVAAARAALEELRISAEEDRVLGLLALGDHATVVAATEQAAGRHPFRERTWALHALALVRSGRQADALDALRRIRAVLADELGLDPGQELRDFEQAVLRQDPALQQWLRPAVDLVAASVPQGPATSKAVVLPASGDRWETVGRDAEQAALNSVLGQAERGESACALLVGEPGIGKTRLVEQLAGRASERGFQVAVGRCSQDDGAPPLWPWVSLLRALAESRGEVLDPALEATLSGAGSPAPSEGAGAAAFRTWERIATAVGDAAEHAPTLVVIDDLHWADTATLRALNHLLATPRSGTQLAVVTTRRPFPEPRGPLAEVGETLARHHAVRLDLVGLDDHDAGRLLTAVAGGEVAPSSLAAWQSRAEGNPFFLIELARFGASGGGQHQHEIESSAQAQQLPATVRDVIVRRVETLPETTRELLLLAAVLGRRFSLDLLAAVVSRDPDEVESTLHPARQLGLLMDVEAGMAAFTHALTRDAVVDSASPTRVARLHAQVAHALDNDPAVTALLRPEERVTELARHWLAAGPTHTARAWRAAADAAAHARQVFSHAEAASLMADAIAAHRRDPAGTPEDRFELLLTRAGDCQRSAAWRNVVACAFEAIDQARSAQDPVAVARAAAEVSRHTLWTPHEWDEVFEDTIDDLRWAMRQLPERDSVERCQVMLALALELYYVPTAVAEVQALVEEGLDIARRIGDPALVWWATRAAWIAWWQPSRAEQRKELAAETLTAARELADEELESIALAAAAACALELGEEAEYRVLAADSERIGRRRRLAFVLLALGWVELGLAAMRSDADAIQARTADLMALRPFAALPAEELHDAGIALTRCFWQPELLAAAVDPMMAAADASGDDLGRDALYIAMARSGRLEELRERMREEPPVDRAENWGTSLSGCCRAEVAASIEDRHEARKARDILRPLTGRMSVSGISLTIGPIDGYLALAEATLGHHAVASLLADAAVIQAESWDLPRYVDWLHEWRAKLGF